MYQVQVKHTVCNSNIKLFYNSNGAPEIQSRIQVNLSQLKFNQIFRWLPPSLIKSEGTKSLDGCLLV